MRYTNPMNSPTNNQESSTTHIPWQEPHQSGVITLPKIHTDIIDPLNVYNADSQLSIPASDAFIDTWKNGPIDKSQKTLQKHLRTIGIAFNELAKKGQGHTGISTKDSHDDLVTEVDRGLEMLLRLWLKKWYPDHKVIGEEGKKDHLEPSDTVWYIDPIDGTTNFVNGNDLVTIHLACIKDNAPYASFVGVPLQDKYYDIQNGIVCKNGTSLPPHLKSNRLVIGTEYLDSRPFESAVYDTLLKYSQSPPHRMKSIGLNLLGVLEGHCDIFYKPGCKLWDFIAPLCLIACHHSHTDIHLIITGHPDEALTQKNARSYSPFSNDSTLIDHLNRRHQTHCKAGFIIAYPNNRIDMKETIFNSLYD